MKARKFKETYLGLAPVLYRTAFAILRNAEDAEDAVQDTFLRLYEETERLADMERPEAYFTITVRHISLNILRQRRDCPMDDEEKEPSTTRGTADSLEARDELRSLLLRLNADERRILLMRHAAECSFADIATATGRTESSVRMLLSRIRRRLRNFYES